jgi:maleylpyruvate isomerase
MNSPESAADEQLDKLRGLVTAATQQLLGGTIEVSDELWGEPSRLPDWSRAHVATHLARQADGLGRVAAGATTGTPQPMYASPEQRETEIQQGAGRSGLDLQIDLDTSASRLEAAFDTIADAEAWDTEVQLRGGLRVPTRLLPLARMLEVVIHHVDLDIGFEVTDIDAPTAEWLLEWCAFWLRHRDEFPKLELHADSGFTITVGNSGEPIPISGTSANLLGWLMNRADRSAVTGDHGLQLPRF